MALDKRRLKREIERERKAKVKARIVAVRALIKEARERRSAELAVIRDQCKAERAALSITCANRRAEARELARADVAKQRGELGSIAGEERTYREVDAINAKRRPRMKAGEKRAESDDEVRSNLPRDLVPVFDAVRRGIKGSPRKSRTESFLQWAEENAGEVWSLRSSKADREVEQLIREHESLMKERTRPPRKRREAVPF